MTAEGGYFYLSDVNAVNKNLALLNIVITADKREYGGLARAGRADEGNRLLGIYLKGHVTKHPFALVIGEPYVLELNIAPYRLKLDGIGLVNYLGLHIKDGEYLLCRGECRLHPVKLLGKVLDRVKEPGDEHIEGHQHVGGDGLTEELGIVNISPARQVEECHNRGDIKHIYHRTEDTEDENLPVLRLTETLVFLLKLGSLSLLAVKDLGDLHSRQILGEEGVDVGGAVLYTTVGTAGKLTEDNGEEDDEGHEAKHHKRKHIVEAKHRNEHTHDDKAVFDKVNQEVSEHHRDRSRIVADSGNKLSYGNSVKLAVGETLDMGKHVLTQIRQDPLSDLLQDDGLEVGCHKRENKYACIDDDVSQQLAHLKSLAEYLFYPTDKERREDVVGDGDKHNKADEGELEDVGPCISENSYYDFRVLHMTVKADGLLLILHRGIGYDKDDREGADYSTEDEEWIKLVDIHITPPPHQASAALPSCDIRQRWREARRVYRPQEFCRRLRR